MLPLNSTILIGIACGLALAVILLLYFLGGGKWRFFGQSRYFIPQTIRLDELGWFGPPLHGPQMTIYNIPVRLALVVVAPIGRDTPAPSPEVIEHILSSLIPGLPELVVAHQSKLVVWPPQISTTAFSQVFFSKAKLPGDGGKGTPWCGIVGRSSLQPNRYLIGMLATAKSATGIGHIVVNRTSRWLDIIRIK